MLFEHLPIEIDDAGRAFQRAGVGNPFDLSDDARGERAVGSEIVFVEPAAGVGVRRFDLDPVVRASAGLVLHTLIDFGQRRVLDARLSVALCREVEPILRGRAPSDAVHLAARADGGSSGAHAVAAAMALEMMYGTAPPPLAIITRNLGAGCELLAESIRRLFMLAGPDYAEAAITRTSLSLWSHAQETSAPGAPLHGLRRVADIMRGLNPISGHLYIEAWQHMRLARECVAMLFGKSPHPATLFAGGVGLDPDRELYNQVLSRINRLIDFAKRATALWDDLVEFFQEAEPQTRRLGEGPANFLSCGLWDDPLAYDARLERSGRWGERRLSTPGVVINGTLRTMHLPTLNLGIEEFVEHAWYDSWPSVGPHTDPFGAPLSPYHPWQKETLLQPGACDWQGKYSWTSAPRWDREAVETGPLARLWITALAGKVDNEFIRAGGGRVQLELPKFQMPATRLTWSIPALPNALERNRARAFQIAYSAMAAYGLLLNAFDCLRRGELGMAQRYRVPERALGIGFWEGEGGAVTHHARIEGRKLANYQINAPLNWLASPRDPFGAPGPIEAAVMRTPLLEECVRIEDFTGIDILRTIRSFAP